MSSPVKKDYKVKVKSHGGGIARVKPVKKIGKDEEGNTISTMLIKNPDKSTITNRYKGTDLVSSDYNPKSLKPKKPKKLKKVRVPKKLKTIKAPEYTAKLPKLDKEDEVALAKKKKKEEAAKRYNARQKKLSTKVKNAFASVKDFLTPKGGVGKKFTAGGPMMLKEDQAYWYKVDGKTVTKAEYIAAHKKGVAKPGSENFTDGKGLQTNDPDAFGYKKDTENKRKNNKSSKKSTVLTKKQMELSKKSKSSPHYTPDVPLQVKKKANK